MHADEGETGDAGGLVAVLYLHVSTGGHSALPLRPRHLLRVCPENHRVPLVSDTGGEETENVHPQLPHTEGDRQRLRGGGGGGEDGVSEEG